MDATLGDGGHAGGAPGSGREVLGIDRDPDALGSDRRSRLGDSGIQYLQACLRCLPRRWPRSRASSPTSSCSTWGSPPGNWTRERGIYLPSWRAAGHADGRHGSPTAADLLNTADDRTLERLFGDYGDERRARRLARRDRAAPGARQPFAISDDLVNAIRAVLGPAAGPPNSPGCSRRCGSR